MIQNFCAEWRFDETSEVTVSLAETLQIKSKRA